MKKLLMLVGLFSAAAAQAQEAPANKLCDQPVNDKITIVGDDVPEEQKDWLGLWKGHVAFENGGGMCIAMVVKEIRADGKLIVTYAWNAGTPASSGVALDWGGEAKGDHFVLEASNDGNHYRYVITPDVLKATGQFYMNGVPETVELSKVAMETWLK